MTRVVPASPAEISGLHAHDVILTFKGQAVGQPGDLAAAVKDLKVGETYPMTINRDGKEQPLQVPWQEYLSLQTGFEAFRTHKGIINSGLLCELTLVNPATKLRVPLPPFEVAEYRGDGKPDPGPADNQLLRQRKKRDEDGGPAQGRRVKRRAASRGPLPEPGTIPGDGPSGFVYPNGGPTVRRRVFQGAQRRVARSDHRRDDRRRGQLLPQGAHRDAVDVRGAHHRTGVPRTRREDRDWPEPGRADRWNRSTAW